MPDNGMTTTYSPDDNKLRLYAAHRLDPETYKRVKEAGFRWAPKQEVFVAPMWTPEREDLLLELAGEIGDEDTSLVERAEERAGRFEEYSEKRGREAAATLGAVKALGDGIPLGQPILVGHHSQRRAERDAEKIEGGMRRAVKLWRTSEYWTARAQGAIRHAKYKERPDVRARRIRQIEAQRRKSVRTKEDAEKAIRIWSTLHEPRSLLRNGEEVSFRERALYVAANTDTAPWGVWSDLDADKITPEEAQERALAAARSTIERRNRWIEHYDHRLAYERAMLEEQGGTVADQVKPEKGGAVQVWCSPGHGRGWCYIRRVNKVSVTVEQAATYGDRTHRYTVKFEDLRAVMSAAEVEAAREAGRLVETADGVGFFLHAEGETAPAPRPEPEEAPPLAAEMEAVMETLRGGGVKAVSAPQLFPTPQTVGAQVVDLADLQPGHRILEPSAGTGALLDLAIRRAFGFECGTRVVAVEISHQLAEGLRERQRKWLYANGDNFDVRCADFLTLSPEDLGTFHRIVMNPPFERGADLQHIEHARRFLLPGGRLVAVCANGPRQRERLQPIAREWVDLPAGSFKVSGTNVNTAIVVLDGPGE